MTDSKKITVSARKSYETEDYLTTFNILSEGGIFFLFNYAEKEEFDNENPKQKTKTNWLAKGKSADFFWNVFVLQDHIFDVIFKSDIAHLFLHNYFIKYRKHVDYLEDKLARKFPEVYISAIRLNQVFLKPERKDYLQSLKFYNNKAHQKIWKYLYESETLLWNNILKSNKEIKKFKLVEILSHVVFWLEQKIDYLGNSNIKNLTHLGSVYSFFIELLISEFQFPVNEDSLEVDQFYMIYKGLTDDHVTSESFLANNIILNTLENIGFWINLYESDIMPYCFDLNINLEYCKGDIYLNQTPKSFYCWKVDGERYHQNSNRYNNTMQNSDNGFMNFEEEFILTCNKFMNDLQIKKYGSNLEVNTVHDFLIRKTKKTQGIVFIENTTFFNQEAKSNNTGVEILNSFKFRPSKYSFNRYNNTYNVWTYPFLKIKEKVFCPSIFLKNNWGIYTFAQFALTSTHHKNETNDLEQFLSREFQLQNWNVKVITDAESNRMTGDVDIFVNDVNTTLLIQMKRPCFRLNPRDSYYESMLSDTKAYNQLNDAEQFLKEPNDIYELKHLPVKWIVSTSFEFIQKDYHGCKKENYFEIIYVLRHLKFNSLKEFIRVIERDEILKKCSLSIENINSNEFRRLILIQDANTKIRLDKLYENATTVNLNGDKEKALELLKECILIDPNDFDSKFAIANIYADLKDYDNAYSEFEKALNIIPNDPQTMRDYAVTLMESGNYFIGLKIALDVYNLYPFFADVKFVFEEHFKRFKELRLINENQIEVIESLINKKLS